MVVFLNHKGGKIYLGIQNDKMVIEVKNPDALQLADQIRNNICLSALGFFEVQCLIFEGS